MKAEEFNRLYMCSFEPDQIYLEIEGAFRSIYFKDGISDKDYRREMYELKRYAKESGLTNSDYQSIVRRVSGEHQVGNIND